MIPMIIDTDPGVDDAMAIAYAIAHPEIDLLALTTVFGNTSIDFATRNARYLLDAFGAPDVIVARGASVPLLQAAQPYPDFVHGADGLGTVYPTDAASLDPALHAGNAAFDAVDCLIRTARSRPGELRLVAVGPMTNIAAALAREPELPSLVHSLTIMGGAVDEPGNVTPLAEANFYNDPHAADAVLAEDWPVTVVGLDVTHRIMIRDTDLDRLGRDARQTGGLIRATSRFYVDFYTTQGAARDAHRAGAEPACAMHDAAAIAAVVMPDAFTLEHGPARVIDEGLAAGQLALDRRGFEHTHPAWSERPPVAVCMAVDAPRVLAGFLDTLIAGHRT